CLLLTLLAVPVFYSLFDDLSRSRVWSRIGGFLSAVFGRARRRAAAATASLLGSMFKIFIITACLIFVAAHQTRAQVLADSPAPAVSAQTSLKPPAIVADYKAEANKPLPSLARVGVDADQQPLTVRDAIALALQNNKDIEVARDNVKIAEFDLLTARGS